MIAKENHLIGVKSARSFAVTNLVMATFTRLGPCRRSNENFAHFFCKCWIHWMVFAQFWGLCWTSQAFHIRKQSKRRSGGRFMTMLGCRHELLLITYFLKRIIQCRLDPPPAISTGESIWSIRTRLQYVEKIEKEISYFLLSGHTIRGPAASLPPAFQGSFAPLPPSLISLNRVR